MTETEYKKIVKKNTPKESKLRNAIVAFLVGGLVGSFAELLTTLYSYIFEIAAKEATTYAIITLIFLGCLFTALGFFEKFVHFARAGLIVPITGFAHSMMSATMEYKKEGFVTGIGANMFKLAGSVIIYGVVGAYFLSLIVYILGG